MPISFNYKLLIIIAVIGLITLVSNRVNINLFSKLSVTEEYYTINSEYENMYQNLNMKSIYEESQMDLIKKINNLNIDTEILQDQIINVLSYLSAKNDIELSNIKFSERMPAFSDTYEPEETLEGQKELEDTAVCMKVTVDFNSDFNDMISFIDDIKNSETEIAVTDISTLLLDDDKVHVMVNLMFYALPLASSR